MRKAIIAIAGLMLVCGSAMAQKSQDYVINSAKDLAALCSTKPGSPNYETAIYFCHGYGHGAYQYYKAHSMTKQNMKFVCLPNPGPKRSEAIAGYVAWLKKNPKHNNDPAIDAIFRYLGTKYPC